MKVKREGIEIRHFSKHYTGAIFLSHILSICIKLTFPQSSFYLFDYLNYKFRNSKLLETPMLVIMVMMMMTILVMIMMMITTERSPLEDNGSRQMIANGLSVGATLDSVDGDDDDDDDDGDDGDDGDDCDNDDGDEGDEENVNMAIALLQKLLDGVNI